MRKWMMALAIGALTVGVAGEASAQVNVRQLNQERRIDAGRRSGKLTPREAARLRAQQRSIDRYARQQRAANGGHLSARAKRVIHARQRYANHAILVQKHDRQRSRNKLKL